jgi:biopolymer transport protein ExbD
MAFGAFNPQRQQSMMSDINVTPMVDVMLVLLVFFIMAAPMLTSAVRLELPGARAGAMAVQPETVTIAIDVQGSLFWNEERVDRATLDARLTAAAAKKPQPELHLRADKSTRYEVVAQVMAAAQTRGLTKLGFVTDPTKENANGKR